MIHAFLHQASIFMGECFIHSKHINFLYKENYFNTSIKGIVYYLSNNLKDMLQRCLSLRCKVLSCSGEGVFKFFYQLQINMVSYQSTSFCLFSVKPNFSYMFSQQHTVLHRAGANTFQLSVLALLKFCIAHYLSPLLLKMTYFFLFSFLLEIQNTWKINNIPFCILCQYLTCQSPISNFSYRPFTGDCHSLQHEYIHKRDERYY